MCIHPWWLGFGQEVAIDDLVVPPAKALAAALRTGIIPGATLVAIRQTAEPPISAVHMEIDVERPQDLAHPIRAIEPVVAVFSSVPGYPSVFAIRDDFPNTHHQNWVPATAPCSLCIDDRPWAEARLTWTPASFVRQIQVWLTKASRGELHETGRPIEPLFFGVPYALVVPRQILEQDTNTVVELTGYQPVGGSDRIIIAELAAAGVGAQPLPGQFVTLKFRVAPQPMSNLRHAPQTLAALADAVRPLGLNLLEQLRARLIEWAGLQSDHLRRLSSTLAIIVAFPIESEGGTDAMEDMRAFIVPMPAGDVGVELGWLLRNNSGVSGNKGYLPAIGGNNPMQAAEVRLLAANIHMAFDRELAAIVAGRNIGDSRRAVLVGAGSIGSQLAMNLAREGYFRWSVVDDDYLMPHNLARHALPASYVGSSKANALAIELSRLLREHCPAIINNVLFPAAANKPALDACLVDSEIIIDTSASVAVSRHLAHLRETSGRRIAAFFNPAGTACVLLAESFDRSVTLHDLEAQYHRLVQSDPSLENHLATTHAGLRYSGSCRAATNRIPATRAAVLSALAARGVTGAVDRPEASIQIWSLTETGSVNLARQVGKTVTHREIGEWHLVYDEGLLAKLSRLRDQHLPNETGGVLLGLIDRERRMLHLVDALPQPNDSISSVTGFERGVEGLLSAVNRAAEKSMYQLQYVGEWHSHPQRSSAEPSVTDLNQVTWLGEQMDGEGTPVVMAIAADNGSYTFVTTNPAHNI